MRGRNDRSNLLLLHRNGDCFLPDYVVQAGASLAMTTMFLEMPIKFSLYSIAGSMNINSEAETETVNRKIESLMSDADVVPRIPYSSAK